jgi:hypothetical protein
LQRPAAGQIGVEDDGAVVAIDRRLDIHHQAIIDRARPAQTEAGAKVGAGGGAGVVECAEETVPFLLELPPGVLERVEQGVETALIGAGGQHPGHQDDEKGKEDAIAREIEANVVGEVHLPCLPLALTLAQGGPHGQQDGAQQIDDKIDAQTRRRIVEIDQHGEADGQQCLPFATIAEVGPGGAVGKDVDEHSQDEDEHQCIHRRLAAKGVGKPIGGPTHHVIDPLLANELGRRQRRHRKQHGRGAYHQAVEKGKETAEAAEGDHSGGNRSEDGHDEQPL